MRFMMLVRADKDTESGALPPKEIFAQMTKYNEEMAKAGVLLEAEGLHPSAKGARVEFAECKPSVVRGPFADPRELIAGYWLIQAQSMEEAIDWASRAPFESGAIELRQVQEVSDFPAELFPPELASREQALRERLQSKGSKPS